MFFREWISLLEKRGTKAFSVVAGRWKLHKRSISLLPHIPTHPSPPRGKAWGAFFAFILTLALTPTLFSQAYNFRNYSVKDGVAQSQVYSLLQDSRGFLWMGTRGGGITRFDGVNFKTYSVRDGLINNYIFNICEDTEHNLWIGTTDGLSKYNGISFQNFKPAGSTSQLWVQEIAIDKQGGKWLATNEGVYLLRNNKFINVSEKLKQKKAVVNAIHVDKYGAIWYGTSEGLYKITKKGSSYSLEKRGKSARFIYNSITAIKEDHKGGIYIGTYGNGAYHFDGVTFSRIDSNEVLNRQTVLDIFFDKHDNIWIATLSKGVAQYNTIAKSLTWLTENEGLSNNHVRSITQDNSGNFWFGTSGGGVCNYFGKQFTNYDKSSGLAGNFIYSIFRDSHKRLWIGASDKGVSILDSAGFSSFNSENGFADVKVKAISEDDFGNVYIGTDGQGLYRYDSTGFHLLEGFNKKYIRAIVKGNDSSLWVATAGTGLYKITITSYGTSTKNFTTQDGLLHNRLTTLHIDKNNRLWYGTESDGVGCVKDDIVQRLQWSVRDGLRSNSIRCFAEDKSGYLWIGTAGAGISSVQLYEEDFKISSYNHDNGLTSSNIYLLCIDQSNNLFVGTETGLDYLSFDKQRKPLQIKHYSKGEGFTGIETCQNAVWSDNNGTIWFGTINGLSKYNAANKVKNEYAPIISISDVKLFYESISSTSFKNYAGDWNKVKYLELPYNQNHLSFDFMAINFSNPEAVKYQWKLDGFDEIWSPASNEHSIVYSNLSPGTYTFMVKACNEDGVWNAEPVVLSFVINAPFWMRWWFITLVIVVIGSSIFFLFKWRVNRIQARADAENKKIQMEKDIVELEQKALRLQMNPHFIFNALNSIQSQIGTNNDQAARYYLAKFSRLMRQILDNSRNTFITLEEEAHTIENYLLIEKFCNGDRFDYTVTIQDSIEKDYVKIPPMLLQPFVENAIKHGLKHIHDKRGKIDVEFIEKDNLLECSVTDNGIGRVKAGELNQVSKETYHKSTALLVTQERLDLMQHDKAVKSLEIIDLYNEHGNASGTKVIVRIPIS
ncbi:MAG: two-component regulator propeller domain-containing protein [Flavobacteriales bacterium]